MKRRKKKREEKKNEERDERNEGEFSVPGVDPLPLFSAGIWEFY